ncbi:hypothetical protein VZT92_018104 [Zoarces viviparus]|uniref:Uncharacterized protein n=1 Tax=Zoarces viviparus TaxID=48416 RepID=A0AAW1EQR8_ZOAVI
MKTMLSKGSVREKVFPISGMGLGASPPVLALLGPGTIDDPENRAGGEVQLRCSDTLPISQRTGSRGRAQRSLSLRLIKPHLHRSTSGSCCFRRRSRPKVSRLITAEVGGEKEQIPASVFVGRTSRNGGDPGGRPVIGPPSSPGQL